MEFEVSFEFIFGSENGIVAFVQHCYLLLVFKIVRPETTFIVFSPGQIVEFRWRSEHIKVKILYKDNLMLILPCIILIVE